MIYKDRSGTYILKPALPHLAGDCIGCAFMNRSCPLIPDCVNENIDSSIDKRISGTNFH